MARPSSEAWLPVAELLDAASSTVESPSSVESSTASVESLHYWFGLVRRFTTTLAAAALGYAALHHTDVGKKTLSALDELKKMCVPSRSDPSHCRRCVLPLPCSLAAGYN